MEFQVCSLGHSLGAGHGPPHHQKAGDDTNAAASGVSHVFPGSPAPSCMLIGAGKVTCLTSWYHSMLIKQICPKLNISVSFSRKSFNSILQNCKTALLFLGAMLAMTWLISRRFLFLPQLALNYLHISWVIPIYNTASSNCFEQLLQQLLGSFSIDLFLVHAREPGPFCLKIHTNKFSPQNCTTSLLSSTTIHQFWWVLFKAASGRRPGFGRPTFISKLTFLPVKSC